MKYLGIKGHNVYNLSSNHSEKTYMINRLIENNKSDDLKY